MWQSTWLLWICTRSDIFIVCCAVCTGRRLATHDSGARDGFTHLSGGKCATRHSTQAVRVRQCLTLGHCFHRRVMTDVYERVWGLMEDPGAPLWPPSCDSDVFLASRHKWPLGLLWGPADRVAGCAALPTLWVGGLASRYLHTPVLS